jgi:hypothetical protein
MGVQCEWQVGDSDLSVPRPRVPIPLSPVQVLEISIDDICTSVVIRPTPVPLRGLLPQADGDTALLRRENWDWKHTSVYLPTPSPDFTATPIPDVYP